MIDYIYRLINRVGITHGQDKVLHFAIGFIVGIVLSLLVSPVVAVCTGALLAVGKELYDRYMTWSANFDFFDMFVTILGTFIGTMTYGFIVAVM